MVVQAAARHLIKLCKLIPLPSKLLLGLASSLSLSLSTVCWDKGSPAASRLTSCHSDSFVFFLSFSAAFCLISSFDILCTADGDAHKESSGFEAQAKGTCEWLS
jgi:hypothetical protein